MSDGKQPTPDSTSAQAQDNKPEQDARGQDKDRGYTADCCAPEGVGGMPSAPMAAPFGMAMPPCAIPIPPLPGMSAGEAGAAPPTPDYGPLLPRLGLTARLALDLVNTALAGGICILDSAVHLISPRGCGPYDPYPSGPECPDCYPNDCNSGCDADCHGCSCCNPMGQEDAECCDYRVGSCCD